MQLENKFTIEAPIDKAWEALNTPETVAPCFPGATLQEYEGDSFTGTVKVKLGPISLTYKGKGTYVSRDDENHKVVIEANGRDSRGNGTASATVTGTMVADGPTRTAVTMVTDMTITGRPAQFGRGVISDVADKIIGQFSACVASKLAPAAEEAAPAAPSTAAAAPAADSVAAPAVGGSANGSGSADAAATAKGPALAAAPKSTGPMRSEVDAIDLLDAAGAPVFKRLAPVAGGVLLMLIIFLIRRARSR
jgi:carbon monoxide dehydrogenase subunit G